MTILNLQIALSEYQRKHLRMVIERKPDDSSNGVLFQTDSFEVDNNEITIYSSSGSRLLQSYRNAEFKFWVYNLSSRMPELIAYGKCRLINPCASVSFCDINKAGYSSILHAEHFFYYPNINKGENTMKNNYTPFASALIDSISKFDNEFSVKNNTPTIKDYIYQNGYTIITWSDGTKTTVKAENPETADQFTGFAAAVAKKFMGNDNSMSKEFKKWAIDIPAEKVKKAEQEAAKKKAKEEAEERKKAKRWRRRVKKMAEKMRAEREALELLDKENT